MLDFLVPMKQTYSLFKNKPLNQVLNNDHLNDYLSQVFLNDISQAESNENFYSNFLKELKFVKSRYSVKLPFKINTDVLSHN